MLGECHVGGSGIVLSNLLIFTREIRGKIFGGDRALLFNKSIKNLTPSLLLFFPLPTHVHTYAFPTVEDGWVGLDLELGKLLVYCCSASCTRSQNRRNRYGNLQIFWFTHHGIPYKGEKKGFLGGGGV